MATERRRTAAPLLAALLASIAAAAPPPVAGPGVAGPATQAAAGDATGALCASPSWFRRFVAAMRLESPAAVAAPERLRALATDGDPRVRSAAIVALARRNEPPLAALAAAEDNPFVVRTMVRCGWPVDAERTERGARGLMRGDLPSQRLLGVEIAGALAAQGRATKPLADLATDTLASVIARLDPATGGLLSPRLAALTGAPDVRLDYRWRAWLDKHRRTLRTDGGMLVGTSVPAATNAVAALDEAGFARFVAALDEAFRKPLDLGVAIDCTASMSAHIAAAQGGIDDLMEFANAASGGMRVALVGYRDKGDAFTTRWWDFTAAVDQARERLWQLSAEGGGDEPEMVQEALERAFRAFRWRTEAQKVLVLVGDAPPTPGFGQQCVDLARKGREAGITTYVLSARHEKAPEEVRHFTEIGRAGGGRVIRLKERADLVAEIAGVALSDTWHDQVVAVFARHRALCR